MNEEPDRWFGNHIRDAISILRGALRDDMEDDTTPDLPVDVMEFIRELVDVKPLTRRDIGAGASLQYAIRAQTRAAALLAKYRKDRSDARVRDTGVRPDGLGKE